MADLGYAAVTHHYEDREQRHEAASMGMWLFLATEVLFFGGLFTAYIVYRVVYPEAFAEASAHLDVNLGTVNTAILLCSSLSVALAVHAVQTGRRRALVFFLSITMVLGTAFLGIKGVEYYREYQEQLIPGLNFAFEGENAAQVMLFFALYFVMTGLHAIHLTIGIITVGIVAVMGWRRKFTRADHDPVELTGLYWHFVDLVWVYLFPLLYLI